MFDTSSNSFLIGAISLGAVSLLYIFYGPSTKTKSSRKKLNKRSSVTGLVNLGNHCFINAVLQSIAPCKSMVNWLDYSIGQQFVDNYNDTNENQNDQVNSLAAQLRKTIEILNNSNHGLSTASPIDIVNALRGHRWAIPDEEQDACELFNVLTNTLELELYSSLPRYSLTDALLIQDLISTSSINSSPSITTRSSKANHLIDSKMILKSLPTKGMLASQLRCRKCNYKYPLHLDTFDTISLVIPNNIMGTPILLQDCLNKFVSNEIIHEVTCEGCSHLDHQSSSDNNIVNQQIKATFIKKLTFAKLPQLLCFHIQRLVWLTNGQPMKRFEHVTFPEYFNMDFYTYKSQKSNNFVNSTMGSIGLIGGASTPLSQQLILDSNDPASNSQLVPPADISNVRAHLPEYKYKYKLYSVIVHLGNASSGHFISYRRDPQSDWYYCSDNNIIKADLTEVLRQSAYMLFYERV